MADRGGQPGNLNASKGKPWADAIRRAIETRGAFDRKQALDALAETLLRQCDAGDMTALKELGDRLDGKPHQSIGGDEGGAALVIKLLGKDEAA